MTNNFKTRIIVILLFLAYATCTAFMAVMKLIPQEMLFVEILDDIIIATVIMVFLYKSERLKERKTS